MILLASASPRRQSLLRLLVKEFNVLPADIDETPLFNELPDVYVERMALEKAQAVYSLSSQDSLTIEHRDIIIAADTSVIVDDKILGKPNDFDDAQSMLRLLSNRSHRVITSLCILDGKTKQSKISNVVTEVTFRAISDEEIKQYWATGEPQDKAGSYGAQGLGAIFITQISGSFSAVIGLPLYETAQLLQKVGITPLKEMSNE